MKNVVLVMTGILLAHPSLTKASIIEVPQDQPTIQAGIDAAVDGDTVLVDTGRYVENINFNGKIIIVASRYLINDDFTIVGQTVIDGGGDTSVVIFDNVASSTAQLVGFTITNGASLKGGGIIITSGSSPIIRHNIITENQAGFCTGVGGGIAVSDSSNPLIFSNEISNNAVWGHCDCVCYFGGGIWIDSTSDPVIGGSDSTGNIFDSNGADYGRELYRAGGDSVINAQFNWFHICPPTAHWMVYPDSAFDLSNCAVIPLSIENQETDILPTRFVLEQPYPNPFNPTTTIEFSVPRTGLVRLTVYDLLGREIETILNARMDAGHHKVQWDAGNASSAMYIVAMVAEGFTQTRKVTVLR